MKSDQQQMPSEENEPDDNVFEQVLESLMNIQNNQLNQHDPSVTRESVKLMIRDAMSGKYENRSLQNTDLKRHGNQRTQEET